MAPLLSWLAALFLCPILVLGEGLRVTTKISTTWTSCRSMALYAADFLYHIDRDKMFHFMFALSEPANIAKAGNSPQEDRVAVLNVAESIGIDPSSSLYRLLAVNLESDTAAAKIESMKRNMPLGIPDCDTFIEVSPGNYSCSLDDNLDSLKGPDGFDEYLYDYQEKSFNAKPTVRVYTIAGSAQFPVIWARLSSLEHVRPVLQLLPEPVHCPFYKSPVTLSGYGIDVEAVGETVHPSVRINELFELANLKAPPTLQSFLPQSTAPKSDSKKQRQLSKFKKTLEESNAALGNGLPFNLYRVNSFDVTLGAFGQYEMIEFMNIWQREVTFLQSFGIKPIVLREAIAELSKPAPVATAYKIMSEAIIYINDLEKDKIYSSWPSSLKELKKAQQRSRDTPVFPKRNFLTLIIAFDPLNPESHKLLKHIKELKSSAPFRLGLLPIPIHKAYTEDERTFKIFCTVLSKYGLESALALQQTTSIGMLSIDVALNELGLSIDSELMAAVETVRKLRSLANDFGINAPTQLPAFFANGELLGGVDIVSRVMDVYDQDLKLHGSLLDKTSKKSLYTQILDLKGAKNRRTGYFEEEKSKFDGHFSLSTDAMKAIFGISHYTSKGANTITMAGDFGMEAPYRNLIGLLKYVNADSETRARVFPISSNSSLPNRIISASMAVSFESSDSLPAVIQFLELFASNIFGNNGNKSLSDSAESIRNHPVSKKIMGYVNNFDQDILKAMRQETLLYFTTIHADWERELLLTVNGRGVRIPNEIGVPDQCLADFLANEVKMGSKLGKLVKDTTLTQVIGFSAQRLLKSIDNGLPHVFSLSTTQFPSPPGSPPIAIGDSRSTLFHVQAILNPLDREGQKFAAILHYLSATNSFSFSLRLIWDGKEDAIRKHQYRFLTPDLKGLPVLFGGFSNETILSLQIDAPNAWVLKTLNQHQDLTAIQLASISELDLEFELEAIAVQGQVLYTETSEVATDLSLELHDLINESKTEDERRVFANFGYFRFDTNPGVWELAALDRHGAMIVDVPIATGDLIVLDSLTGVFQRVHARKEESLNRFGSLRASGAADNDALHIVIAPLGKFEENATLLLISSILKSTTSPCHFWIINNHISDRFSSQLLALAETEDESEAFNFELVRVSWPFWLTRPAELSRYHRALSLLLMDQLLPFNIKRVLLMNPAQIAKANLDELQSMKLDDADLVMPAYCTDKPGAKSFQFWTRDFWSQLLSKTSNPQTFFNDALVLFNLQSFREKRGFDVLRSKYQALVSDHYSLLDPISDLLNSLRADNFLIKETPKGWAWCKHWCSEKSLSEAKSIHICPNPNGQEAREDVFKKYLEDLSASEAPSDLRHDVDL